MYFILFSFCIFFQIKNQFKSSNLVVQLLAMTSRRTSRFGQAPLVKVSNTPKASKAHLAKGCLKLFTLFVRILKNSNCCTKLRKCAMSKCATSKLKNWPFWAFATAKNLSLCHPRLASLRARKRAYGSDRRERVRLDPQLIWKVWNARLLWI